MSIVFSLKKQNHLFPLFFSFAGALTLSLEYYFSLQGKSLCETAACQIVGESLRFGEPLLIAGGAAFFWIFLVTCFFAHKYPRFLQQLPLIFLLSALAFDGALIGYQHFSLQQKCILCLSVAALLITLALSLTAIKKSYCIFLAALGVWFGSFIALGILKMPLPSSAYANMAFYEHRAQPIETKQLILKGTDTYTLIMSLNCQHCSEVVSYLSDTPQVATNFKLVTIDQDADSLKRISRFKKEAVGINNPFKLLKSIKADSVSSNQYIAKDLPKQSAYGLQFLSNLGITGIPVLVVESTSNIHILRGSEAIISFLQNSKN